MREGRKEGRKEGTHRNFRKVHLSATPFNYGRTDEQTDGRKGGGNIKEGRKEGRKEREISRKEGRKDTCAFSRARRNALSLMPERKEGRKDDVQ